MAVFGSYLPANTQVVAVAGNTVTLSSTVDLSQFYSVIGSFFGSAGRYIIGGIDPSAAGAVGQLIANSSILPLSRGAIITSIRYYWINVGKGSSQRKRYDISQAVASNNVLATFNIYQFDGIPSATYIFGATNTFYTFRANSNLPFGSFPGIGAFST
jgi:hypothetical protein